MEGGWRDGAGGALPGGKTGRCEPESRLRCNAILLFIRQAGEGEEGVGSHATSIYLGDTFRGGAALSLISVRRRLRPDLFLPVRRLIGLDGQTGFRPCRYQERARWGTSTCRLPVRVLTVPNPSHCEETHDDWGTSRLVFTRCPVSITPERFGKDAVTKILPFFHLKSISRKKFFFFFFFCSKKSDSSARMFSSRELAYSMFCLGLLSPRS